MTKSEFKNLVLSLGQTKFLFAARARMLFVRANYPGMHSEKFCLLCETDMKKVCDTQEHLLECEKLDYY